MGSHGSAQIIICAHRRRVIVAGRCWPGNRNDVTAARHTVAHLLDGARPTLSDGRYRSIPTITSPRRGHHGRIVHDAHHRTHRRIRARVQHVIARLKDWPILGQCGRRRPTINHTLQIITGLLNLKTSNSLRVNS